MKTAILVFTACVSLVTGLAFAEECLLKNPDFEEPALEEQRTPAGWAMGLGRNLYRWVNDDGHSGSHSIRYVGGEGREAVPVTQLFTCEPETDYVLSAAFKSDGGTRPTVQVVVSGDKPVPVASVVSKGEAVWTIHQARFNSGTAGELQVRIFGDQRAEGAEMALEGSSGIDDVQVCPAAGAPGPEEPSKGFVPPGPNLALNRPYTLHPAPNYSHCTDAADKTQLTDGEYSVGYFWVQKTTVGWRNATPVIVTIDLGQIEPIGGVSYNTAAGVAGVSWPSCIGIFVSDEGNLWTRVGDLVGLGTYEAAPPPDRYSVFRFATDALRTRARYIILAVDAAPYVFVDEIEVYRGPEELMEAPPEGKKIEDVAEHLEDMRVLSAALWRIRTDLRAVRTAIEAAPLETAIQASLLEATEKLGEEIETAPKEIPEGFQTILPFSGLHTRIYALNAFVLRSRGLPPLSVWVRNRWDPLNPMDAPEPEEVGKIPSLELSCLRNEVRALAFNLTYCGNHEVALRVRLIGLPEGPNPNFITVHEVLFTDTRDRVPIAAALPEAREVSGAYEIHVPAGCTRQVWLSFDTKRIQAGTYGAWVEVSPPVGEKIRIPLTVKVHPFEMPDERTVAVGGWDYTDGEGRYDAIPSNIPVLIETLRGYGVNAPWATNGVMPRGGEYDAEGKLTSALDFARWDEWIERWPGAKYYCVFPGVGDSFEGEHRGTPRFDRMVGDWAKAWVKHIREQGLDPNRVALLLVDEPRADEPVDRIVAWARAIKAAAPEMLIWEDPVYHDPTETPARLLEVCDVLCPNLPMFMNFTSEGRDVFTEWRKEQGKLWFYSCSGPAKQLDPYNYFRGQFWWALKYGAVGSCYWAFGDEGKSGNSWNAYLQTRNQYSPLFLDPTSVTRGKHMEAIREGQQDYEYFVMLKKRIEELEAKGVSDSALDEARSLLEAGPDRVVSQLEGADLRWHKEFDRSLMDEVRMEVLDMLERLEGLK